MHEIQNYHHRGQCMNGDLSRLALGSALGMCYSLEKSLISWVLVEHWHRVAGAHQAVILLMNHKICSVDHPEDVMIH